VKYGIVYPQVELRGDPDAVRRIGKAVEDLGFDYLLVYDHVLGAVHTDRDSKLWGPYTERDPFHDPFVMFAYLAAMTTRLEFATGVLVLPQRQTALVARQAADVDVLSGGRLRLGVGVGWNYVEYDALGQDFRTRGAREEEQIALLRKLWTEPVVEFTGRFDRVDRAGTLPLPGRAIPLWLGGFSAVAISRAARIGDGFMFAGGGKTVFEQWADARRQVAEAGRPPDSFEGEWIVTMRGDQSLDDLPALAESWRAAGGSYLSVVTMGRGFDSTQAHLDYIGQLAQTFGLKAR